MVCKNCGKEMSDTAGFCSECGAKAEASTVKISEEEIMKVVKIAICSKLKSPASAQFPAELISIVGDDERGYQVQGFVDSQNSYGAMLRNDFTANVTIQNGFPVVTSSSVGAKAAVNSAKQFGISYLAITLFTIIGGALMYWLIMKSVGL